MKKIFTLALAAAAATSAFNADAVQGRLNVWGPFVNVPEDAVVVFNAMDQLGENGNLDKYQLYIWESTLNIESGMDATVGEYQNFVCANGKGWAGLGVNIAKKSEAPNIVPFPAKEMNSNWRLHFMYKNNQAANFKLQVGPEIGTVQPEFKFSDSHDGTWQTVDMPVTDILDQYVNTDEETVEIMFFRNWTDVNLWGALAVDGVVDGGSYALADMYYYTDNYTNSVNGIEAEGNVVAEDYYSFDGKKLAEAPQQGLYLVKKTFENGAVKTLKVAK